MTLLTLTVLFIGAMVSASLLESSASFRPFGKAASVAADANRRQRVIALVSFMLCTTLMLLMSILQ